LAVAGAVIAGGNFACSLLTAELSPFELVLVPALDELVVLLLEPQAATPSEAIASSPGRSTPSNLDLDRIILPFG